MSTNVPVYDDHGSSIVGWIRRDAPVCNEDHCDECGDCLHCYGEDPCPGPTGVHTWLYYLPDLSEADRALVTEKPQEDGDG